MIKIFIGYDERQPISFHVLSHSIIKHTSIPVEIIPLINRTLPLKRKGLTPFTFTRFLVPYLCEYKGIGIFLDADMLVTYDINDLLTSIDINDDKDIWIKDFEKYKFEKASVMVFNNSRLKHLTPEYIENAEALHTISFVNENKIGIIPSEWNVLVGYEVVPNNTKLYHFTQGVPIFKETKYTPCFSVYLSYARECMSAKKWSILMGSSVHAVKVKDDKFVPRFMFNIDEERGQAYLKEEYKEPFNEIMSYNEESNELLNIMDFVEH